MSRKCYAVSWPYGRLAWSSEVGTPREAVAFDSPQERDDWLAKGNPYTTQPGTRQAVSAKEVKLHHLQVVTLDEIEAA